MLLSRGVRAERAPKSLPRIIRRAGDVWCDKLPFAWMASQFHPTMNIRQAALWLTFFAGVSAHLRGETEKIGSRGLTTFELIAGYQPTSLVTDPVRQRWKDTFVHLRLTAAMCSTSLIFAQYVQNAMDLDQQAMQVQLGFKTTASFQNAKKIYQEGGNSMTFAVLTLSAPLASPITKGTVITGQNAASQTVTGTALEDALATATTLKMLYDVGLTQATHSTCKVGGLVTTMTTGCLKDSGTVTVNSVVLSYTYVTTQNNDNGRTIQGFSTSADTKMRVNGAGSYYVDFQKAVSYYGTFDYGDKLISGAFDGASVTLNGKVFNFASYGFNGRDRKYCVLFERKHARNASYSFDPTMQQQKSSRRGQLTFYFLCT
jgi:hypothetical protein